MKMNNEPILRPMPSLRDIHTTLRALYDREYPESSPPHLFEMLLPTLPPYIRILVERWLNLLVKEETGETKSLAELNDGERNALAAFFDQKVLRAHLEVGRDSALSNDRNSIAHFDTQPPIVAHDLITVASDKNPESLERMGCVFFDVDGTKTIVDCTSHAHAGKYLEELATFLCHPPASVQQWLQEHRLHAEAYSVAGDEFIVTVRSDAQTIDKKTLDAFALEVQKALAKEAHIASFVSFDDPAFMMEYDEWTDDDRAAYKRDPASMKERIGISRSKLPEHFIPSVSFGSATFLEALHEALSPDTEEAKTLEELGVNAFRLMVARADTRLREDKYTFREHMTDPKWRAFLLRNAENRRLMTEIDDLRLQLKNALERNY